MDVKSGSAVHVGQAELIVSQEWCQQEKGATSQSQNISPVMKEKEIGVGEMESNATRHSRALRSDPLGAAS